MGKTTLRCSFSLLCFFILSSDNLSFSKIYPDTEIPGGITISPPAPRPGKDLAVFFAVEKYRNGTLTNLQNPVKNARDLAAILNSRFGFDTEVLENPTQKQIFDRLNELTRLYARNEDGKHPSDGQLFLFFSGHGLSEDESGYFLPADADPAAPYTTGIAYDIWRPKINKINCRHILVAFDACYSVRFDPDWKNKPDGQFKRPGEMTDSQRALANYETYKARVFFTSDNKEDQTPDRSNFAKKLLEGLRSATATDGFLTSNQLFANHVQGATPTPRAGTFGDDEASSAFLFYDLNGPAKTSPQPIAGNTDADDRAFEKAKSRHTPESYQDYLDVFPNGRHKTESETALAALKNKTTTPATTREKPPSNPLKSDTTAKSDGALFDLTKRHALPDNGLVLIPGGTFTMGCTSEQQDCESAEVPTRQVTVSSFWMATTELTFEAYDAFCDATKCVKPGDEGWGRGKRPVINVSWNDAVAYCNWRSQQENLTPCYTISGDKVTCNWRANGYRLPTEAEWEYAARGGGKAVLFGNGKNAIDPKEINFNASTDYKKPYSVVGEYRGKTVPVGSLNNPNPLGLHDLSGSVYEWCWDWKATYPSAAETDPKGPDNGSDRVVRGGSWGNYPQDCRVAYRNYNTPVNRYFILGFRLARTP